MLDFNLSREESGLSGSEEHNFEVSCVADDRGWAAPLGKRASRGIRTAHRHMVYFAARGLRNA